MNSSRELRGLVGYFLGSLYFLRSTLLFGSVCHFAVQLSREQIMSSKMGLYLRNT